MSPDQYSFDKRLQTLRAAGDALVSLSRVVGELLYVDPTDFAGFSVFLADGGDFLAMLKRYGEDGSVEVLFAAGQTPLEAIGALSHADRAQKWRKDTRQK